MKKFAICDDNELQREILVTVLEEYYRRNNEKVELTEYISGEALIDDVKDDECDAHLIFLDICMPGIDGINTAKKLRELKCRAEIVFLTATAEYALEGYDVQAAGYLVKPIEEYKLKNILRHVFWKQRQKRIEIKCGRQYRYPAINDIMWDFSKSVTEHTTLLASYSEFKEDASGNIPIGKGKFSVSIRVENHLTEASIGTSSKELLNMLI